MVTDFGTNQNRICDFVVLINTNLILSCTISKLSQILYENGHFAFLNPLWGA